MKKIAYLILAHTDSQHFQKLTNALGPECDIYVHIDSKANILDFKAVQNNNVIFIKNRVSVSWASISMIEAQMSLIAEALEKGDEYTHLILLSGSCYPIKSQSAISEMFSENPHKEFIKFIDMRKSPEHYMKLISRKWFKEPFLKTKTPFLVFIDKAVRRILNLFALRNEWEEGIIPYFGSQWWALTPNCCQYVLDYHLQNPQYREMNEFTFSPDEHYIHTIIGNSLFREMSVGIQSFEGRGTWRLANLHIISPSLSKWFTTDNWEEIRNSDKLFVRKIRTLDGLELVERIDDEIL